MISYQPNLTSIGLLIAQSVLSIQMKEQKKSVIAPHTLMNLQKNGA
nr:hypothetical protein [uncultured Moraxella sp.]